MKVRLAAEAEAELLGIARYYAEKASPVFASAFIDEFERSCRLLEQTPSIGRSWHAGTRRLVLRRFPFNLIYRIGADEIQVIALAHQRRKPDYWTA